MTSMPDAHYIIGLEVDMNKRALDTAAGAFIKAARKNTNPLMVCVVGYDDDPRELWQIPEVMTYFRAWYQLVKQKGGHGLDRLAPEFQALVLYANGIGKFERTATGSRFTCPENEKHL